MNGDRVELPVKVERCEPEELSEKERELRTARGIIWSHEKEIEDLKRQAGTLKAEVQKLKEQIRDLTQKINILQEEVKLKTDQLKRSAANTLDFAKESENHKRLAEELERQRQAKEIELSALNKTYDSLVESFLAAKQTTIDDEGLIQNLKEELEKVKRRADIAVKDCKFQLNRVYEVTAQLTTTTEENGKLKKQIKTQETAMDGTLATLKHVTEAALEETRLREGMRKEIDEQDMLIAQLKDQLRESEEKMHIMSQSFKTLKIRNRQLRLQMEPDPIGKTAQDLQEEERKAQLQALKESLAAKDKEIACLTATLEQTRALNNESAGLAVRNVDGCSAEVEELKRLLEEKDNEVLQLVAGLEQMKLDGQKNAADQEAKNAKREEELAGFLSTVEAQKVLLTSLTQSQEELKRKITVAEAKNRDLTWELEKARGEAKALQKNEEEAFAINKMKTKLRAATDDLSVRDQALQHQIVEREKDKQQHKEKVRELKQRVDELLAKIKELKDQKTLSQLDEECSTKVIKEQQTKIEQMQHALDIALGKEKALVGKIHELERKLAETGPKLDEATRNFQTAESQFTAIAREAVGLSNENVKLKEQICELKEDKQRYASVIDSLVGDVPKKRKTTE